MAFATELYAANITVGKTVTDVNGGELLRGDVLEYVMTAASDGADGATDVVLADPIPAGTSFVPGSVVVDGVARSDAPGDDDAEHDAQDRVVARLGARATAAAGGALSNGASAAVRFWVTVAPTATAGQIVANTASVSAVSATGGFAQTFRSQSVQGAVAAPADLGSPVVPGPDPGPGPGPGPATSAAKPSFAQIVKLPSTKRCVSRRAFRIRLVEQRSDPLVSARVLVNGKLVKTVRGKRLTAPVDLRGLPRGRITVRLDVKTKSGRKITGTRR